VGSIGVLGMNPAQVDKVAGWRPAVGRGRECFVIDRPAGQEITFFFGNTAG